MNKLNIPSPSNGIKLFWEDLEYTLGYGAYDSGLLQGIEAVLKPFGDDFIVSGCNDLGGSVTGDGWIMLSGTLIRVKQHTRTNNYFAAITETNATGARTDNLGGSVNIFQQNRATASSATGNLRYDGIRLNEILGINITVKNATSGINNIANNEKWINVTASGATPITLNLPTPSQYNKGSLYTVFANYTGSEDFIIVGESGNLKSYSSVNVVGVMSFMNDGTNWNLVSEKLTSSSSVPGIVELATDAETQTGTDTTRAVTPAGLASRTSTETRAGVIEIATSAEAGALVDDARAITAAKLSYSERKLIHTITGTFVTYVVASGVGLVIIDNDNNTVTLPAHIAGVKQVVEVITNTGFAADVNGIGLLGNQRGKFISNGSSWYYTISTCNVI